MPPGTSSPSTVAARSIWTKSPRWAGRSTVLRRGEALPQAVELRVDVLVGDLDLVDDDLDVVEVGQRDLGPDVDLGGEPQRLPVAEVGDLDLRPAQRADLVLPDGGQDLLRDRLLDGLGEDRSPARPAGR